MTRRVPIALAAVALLLTAVPASAQSRPRPAPPSRSIQIGGYGMFGVINFAAKESFEAVFGKRSGPIYGGGAIVALPLGGLFVDIGAWRFRDVGERVFVANGEVFRLGIPLTVTITPVEFTAGWRFRRNHRFVPYAGGGLTSYSYKEASSFAAPGEDVNERFNGYHAIGGAEYKVMRWLGLAGEVAWTTVPDAIGTAGVSKAFADTDLGGTSVRAKITLRR